MSNDNNIKLWQSHRADRSHLSKYFLYILRLAHELAIMKSLYTVRMIVASPPRESSLHTFARSYYYYYYYYSCSYISSPPLQNSHTTIESADYNKATYELGLQSEVLRAGSHMRAKRRGLSNLAIEHLAGLCEDARDACIQLYGIRMFDLFARRDDEINRSAGLHLNT